VDSLKTSLNQIHDISIVWTVVLAICAIANVLIAFLMWKTTRAYTKITRQMFLASQRPYIGISTYAHNFSSSGSMIYLETKLQNFGNTPAKNVDVITEVFVDGILIIFKNSKVENQTIFPQKSHPICMIADDMTMFLAIKNGESHLKLHTHITYKGITDQIYSTSEVCAYDYKPQLFVGESAEWT
jgi:hypothetical protein